LKLKYDEPLSNFASNLNVRHYTKANELKMMDGRLAGYSNKAMVGRTSPRHPPRILPSFPELLMASYDVIDPHFLSLMASNKVVSRDKRECSPRHLPRLSVLVS
jgi:hypothetical protein